MTDKEGSPAQAGIGPTTSWFTLAAYRFPCASGDRPCRDLLEMGGEMIPLRKRG